MDDGEEDTIAKTFVDQGSATLDDRASRQFTDQDFEEFFVTSGLPTASQHQSLKASVGEHRRTVKSRYEADPWHSNDYAKKDDDHDEQLQLVLKMSEATVEEENTVRLLLLGKTGSGKSTTGNTILGKKCFNTSPSFGSVTCVCERRVEIRGNTRIEIMDSPGLFDTEKKHGEVCTTIIQTVAGMHPGPNAILFVTKVGRYTAEEHSAYVRLKSIFDDKVSKHMIIVFTHGDDLEREGTTLEALLTSPDVPGNLRQVLRECGQRCILFNNFAENKESQVDKLLEMIRMLTGENEGKPYSCPKYSEIGEELVKEVNKRVAKSEKINLQESKYVQDLEQQTKKAKLKATEARKEFERKEAERELEEKKESERRRKLEEDMNNQQAKFEADKRKQQKELDNLKQQVQRQQEEERKRMENQEKLSREQERKLEQEKERMKRMEQEMKEKLKQQERQEEERREAERKRLEEEKKMIQLKHEEQRRQEKKDVEKMNKELELKMKEQEKAIQEEMERKQKKWKEEMNELQQRVAENEEPGFFSKVVSVLAVPFRAIVDLFS